MSTASGEPMIQCNEPSVQNAQLVLISSLGSFGSSSALYGRQNNVIEVIFETGLGSVLDCLTAGVCEMDHFGKIFLILQVCVELNESIVLPAEANLFSS